MVFITRPLPSPGGFCGDFLVIHGFAAALGLWFVDPASNGVEKHGTFLLP